MALSLRVLLDGEIRRSRYVIEGAAEMLELTHEQRQVRIPSGQEQWLNRGNWAPSYLTRVGAIERTSRGHYRIAEVGRALLEKHPEGITEKDLLALSGDENAPHTWNAFPSAAAVPTSDITEVETALDPQEQIDAGVARINADVADQLLTRIHAQETDFFEQAVLDMLVKMGYGGADGTATRKQLSNDGGIDGIIDQDAIGLFRVYVQAKRYPPDNVVGREAIQAFVGALAGNQADQGVFITTSRFASTAITYAGSVATRVVLIDGDRLARLMIGYGVGVQIRRTIQIVEIDEDFFE